MVSENYWLEIYCPIAIAGLSHWRFQWNCTRFLAMHLVLLQVCACMFAMLHSWVLHSVLAGRSSNSYVGMKWFNRPLQSAAWSWSSDTVGKRCQIRTLCLANLLVILSVLTIFGSCRRILISLAAALLSVLNFGWYQWLPIHWMQTQGCQGVVVTSINDYGVSIRANYLAAQWMSRNTFTAYLYNVLLLCIASKCDWVPNDIE